MKSGKQNNQPAILVVDDELLIRDLLYDFLTGRGFVVHLAENGKKAADLLDSLDIQAAIVDLKMPQIDGLELASILHQKKPFVPVIIMTAYPSMNSAIESIHNDVFDYVVKPFKIAELHEIIKLAIREHEFRAKSGYISASPGSGDK